MSFDKISNFTVKLKSSYILKVFHQKLVTASMHIEGRCSIKISDFQIVRNGCSWPSFVQKSPDFGQIVVKYDQGVPKMCPMAF